MNLIKLMKKWEGGKCWGGREGERRAGELVEWGKKGKANGRGVGGGKGVVGVRWKRKQGTRVEGACGVPTKRTIHEDLVLK